MSQELKSLSIELRDLKKEATKLRARLLRSQIAHGELEQDLSLAEERVRSLESSYENYKKRITEEIQELLRKEKTKRILWVTVSGLMGGGLGWLLASIF
jgi:predicted  nucleic acid-binding Zn-ribbon protein